MSVASASPVRQCAFPACTTPATQRCKRCKITFYCALPHHSAHWPAHKLVCVAPPSATAKKAAAVVAVPFAIEPPTSPFGISCGLDKKFTDFQEKAPRETPVGKLPVYKDFDKYYYPNPTHHDPKFTVFINQIVNNTREFSNEMLLKVYSREGRPVYREYAAYALWLRQNPSAKFPRY